MEREAHEECGVVVGALDPVRTAWAVPAASAEQIYLFLAPDRTSNRTKPRGGLAHEVLSLDALGRMADAGELPDMKTLLLVFALRHRRPELFSR